MVKGDVRIDRDRLETLMRLRGLGIADLAVRMDMHYNSVLRIRNEESTSMKGLEKLCNALECHPFDLIVAQGYPKPFLAAPASL